MRTRTISAVGIAVVGLVPTTLGGPVFALLMATLGLIGYREYLAMTARVAARATTPMTGYAAVAAFAVAALGGWGHGPAMGITAAAVGVPIVLLVFAPDQAGAFVAWALAVAGSLYLGLPVYAAVALRRAGGTIDAGWVDGLADAASLGWSAAPRGLAWVLVVVLVAWIGDSAAYLVGRAWGRRPLIPRVSPKKTVEGAVGGLAGSTLVGGLGVALFGLGVSPLIGAIVGLALGAIGQVGDLAESLLKRQAGVKDSGSFIPGHGGALDRIDALLFVFPVGWLVAELVDRYVG